LRAGYAAENYSTLRHIGQNLLKKDKSNKIEIKAKRIKAAWNPDYLLSLLGRVRCDCLGDEIILT